jgi:predicted metal-dependent hydrolase
MSWKGYPVEVTHRRGAAARIQILPGAVVRVTASSPDAVVPLLEEHAPWIHRQMAQIRAVVQDHPDNADRLLFDGEYYAVREAPSCSVDRAARVITYSTPLALKRTLVTLLRAELMEKIRTQCTSGRIPWKKVSVRMQKTRWASCSSRGTLSFNLVLSALPPHLRDYIVAHELTHLQELNHSRKYWDLLDLRYPGARSADRTLRTYWILIGNNRYWQVLRDLNGWEQAFRKRG